HAVFLPARLRQIRARSAASRVRSRADRDRCRPHGSPRFGQRTLPGRRRALRRCLRYGIAAGMPSQPRFGLIYCDSLSFATNRYLRHLPPFSSPPHPIVELKAPPSSSRYWPTCRASPAQKAVSPARAPLLMPRLGIGDFTEPEVMLTMRPNLRSHMPSTTALISMIGVSMLALTAFCQSSTDHSRKSPCGGPPQLLTRMSGLGLAARAAARPASVEMSPGTAVTLAPVSLRISSAVCSRVS